MNFYRLTKQELNVLRAFSRGASAHQIAKEMQLGKATVNRHANNAMAKLGVHTRAHALYVCGKEGLV